jgi:hypothetical protein
MQNGKIDFAQFPIVKKINAVTQHSKTEQQHF